MSEADRELFHKWVAKAEEDLVAAANLLKDEPVLASVICFHCQQGAEKYLKALLALHGKAAPKIHDLETLIGLGLDLDASLGNVLHAAKALTDYAVDARYPDAPFEFTAALAQEAEKHALAIKSAVLRAVQPILNTD